MMSAPSGAASCGRTAAYYLPIGRGISLPQITMYTVRLQYAINVEASSASEAERKVAKLIKQEPSLAIRGVESKYEHRSILKMLVTGR